MGNQLMYYYYYCHYVGQVRNARPSVFHSSEKFRKRQPRRVDNGTVLSYISVESVEVIIQNLWNN